MKIYKIIYLILGLIGIFLSLKTVHFFYYFTNLSNIFCLLIVFIELIKNKKLNTLKFITLLYITFTFFIFNFILKGKYDVPSIIFHIILPIMYFIDWLLFYKKVKLKYVFYSFIFPLIYFIIFYHTNIYFFFEKDALKWFIKLLIIFICINFTLYKLKTIDKIKK